MKLILWNPLILSQNHEHCGQESICLKEEIRKGITTKYILSQTSFL